MRVVLRVKAADPARVGPPLLLDPEWREMNGRLARAERRMVDFLRSRDRASDAVRFAAVAAKRRAQAVNFGCRPAAHQAQRDVKAHTRETLAICEKQLSEWGAP